jgi:hypothetical protein
MLLHRTGKVISCQHYAQETKEQRITAYVYPAA